jgi:hypothetical protein
VIPSSTPASRRVRRSPPTRGDGPRAPFINSYVNRYISVASLSSAVVEERDRKARAHRSDVRKGLGRLEARQVRRQLHAAGRFSIAGPQFTHRAAKLLLPEVRLSTAVRDAGLIAIASARPLLARRVWFPRPPARLCFAATGLRPTLPPRARRVGALALGAMPQLVRPRAGSAGVAQCRALVRR